jgi:magnesium-transporting ATPase (P-type)
VTACRAVLCCACCLVPAVPLQTGWPELSPGVGSWLVQVVRFIILLAQAVPISLYVSLETVKVAQCKVCAGVGVC